VKRIKEDKQVDCKPSSAFLVSQNIGDDA